MKVASAESIGKVAALVNAQGMADVLCALSEIMLTNSGKYDPRSIHADVLRMDGVTLQRMAEWYA